MVTAFVDCDHRPCGPQWALNVNLGRSIVSDEGLLGSKPVQQIVTSRRLSFGRSAPSRLMRYLDGQMRQRREAGETAPIIVGLPRFRRDD